MVMAYGMQESVPMNSDMRMRRPLRKQASLLDQSGCCSNSTFGQWRSVRMGRTE